MPLVVPMDPVAWYRSTFGQALAGAVLLWAALPPLDLWPLAWVAPVWWVLLIRRRELTGRRPYAALAAAGFLFWLAALHWLRLPHPATAIGWVALSFYFAFYLPVFVGLSRVAVHRLRMPVILAAPVVWTGLELARGHLLTGMTMASLGHTQYRWITLIQLSDLAGAYGVSFVVMLVAACLAESCRRRLLSPIFRWGPIGRRQESPPTGSPLWPLAPAAAVLAAALVYGYVRTSGEYTAPGARVALIQGSIDTQIKNDPQLRGQVFRHYLRLSEGAVREYGPPDLIIWPETMFRDTLVTYEPGAKKPDELDCSDSEFRWRLELAAAESRRLMAATAEDLGAPLILGVDSQFFARDGLHCFNSAALVARDGELLARYDKMHLVTFGEYVPLGRYFPRLQQFTPLPANLDAGRRPVCFRLRELRIAPNICYESVLPHLIRRQIRELQARGEEPNVLVNLTNDGWFWGSSELDMHLVCGVFRAVECRKPLMIAANTGFSAWIDGDGRILRQGPRRRTAAILADVRLDQRRSWYLAHGDWPAGICLAACGLLALVGLWPRWSRGWPWTE